ncbi:MAG: lipid-A-disaccharide synthase [Alphaproteobacteria bacterium 41-28]|nr:MAG: lipid-A-disaccharide synthase [Alphaproteobacteria bacterium 41-28]
MSRIPLIFLVAGEASGDRLGADLMVSLNRIQDVRFAGIGGEAMAAQGLQSLFPMQDLSVIGVWGILRNFFHLWGRLGFTVKTIKTLKPDVVITIDAPEFSFRVMKRLHKLAQRPRLIHYVAPTVWAWRPGRAYMISQFLDQLLCLYPFEPPYFEKHGLKTTFVGHPVAASLPVIASGAEQSRKTINKRDPNLLCVLPGSRRSEVETLLPIFKQTVEFLKKDIPELKVVIPTVPSVELLVRQAVRDWSIDVEIVLGEKARDTAFQKASAALAASGTVALQLSAAGLPFIIAYKLNKINEWIAKALIKTPWACMVNILLAFQKLGPNFVLTRQAKHLVPRPWIPEFIQEECTPERLAPALLTLLKDESVRTRQVAGMKEAISLLRAPPDTAAKIVLGKIA